MNRSSKTADESLLQTATEYAQTGLQSDLVTGTLGGVLLLQGIRQLRRGRWRGLLTLLVGGGFLAGTAYRRKAGTAGIDQTDVVDTSPDIEDVSAGTDAGVEAHASGEEAASVVDTGPDVEDAGSSPEIEADDDADVDQSDVVDTGTDVPDEETESAE